MNWRDCDDDGSTWDDSRLCWEEVEEFSGPEYFMWRDKLESESKPTWRAPKQTFIVSDDWLGRLC